LRGLNFGRKSLEVLQDILRGLAGSCIQIVVTGVEHNGLRLVANDQLIDMERRSPAGQALDTG